MKIKITPHSLHGKVKLPSSKSLTHRALICASLAMGHSVINHPLLCDDTMATIHCLQQLGVEIKTAEDCIFVNRSKPLQLMGKLDAKDSASTIRFLIPVISTFCNQFSFYGSKRLIERLMTSDIKQLTGLQFEKQEDCLIVNGKLDYPSLYLKQEATSQWLSGVLLSLPFVGIPLQCDIEQDYYTDLTIQMMEHFGINCKKVERKIISFGSYSPQTVDMEVDYSAMANFLGMAIFSPATKIYSPLRQSLQPDFRIFSFLEAMGVSFLREEEWISCQGNTLHETSYSLAKNPDLAPILAAVASVSGQTIRIWGLDFLQYKESNRLDAISEALTMLGARIEKGKEELLIYGKKTLLGGVRIPDYQDHRIIMSLIAISSQIDKPFILEGGEAINKSFPDFYKLFASLGGQYESCI